ncbi:MAG: hypothetical protein QXK20_04110 [Nitrososphaerales archaeon]
MKPPRRLLAYLARQRIERIMEVALEVAKTDYETAKKETALARRIALKYNVRLPFYLKRFFCHGCKQLIIPGLNCRVRLTRRSHMLKMTCLMCGHIYRRPLRVKV